MEVNNRAKRIIPYFEPTMPAILAGLKCTPIKWAAVHDRARLLLVFDNMSIPFATCPTM